MPHGEKCRRCLCGPMVLCGVCSSRACWSLMANLSLSMTVRVASVSQRPKLKPSEPMLKPRPDELRPDEPMLKPRPDRSKPDGLRPRKDEPMLKLNVLKPLSKNCAH